MDKIWLGPAHKPYAKTQNWLGDPSVYCLYWLANKLPMGDASDLPGRQKSVIMGRLIPVGGATTVRFRACLTVPGSA